MTTDRPMSDRAAPTISQYIGWRSDSLYEANATAPPFGQTRVSRYGRNRNRSIRSWRWRTGAYTYRPYHSRVTASPLYPMNAASPPPAASSAPAADSSPPVLRDVRANPFGSTAQSHGRAAANWMAA